MQMPEVDGEMLGCQIKAEPLLAQTKLIMMTSLNHWSSSNQALERGFSAYLVKPVKPSRLMDCIMNTLTSEPIRAAASPTTQRSSRKGKEPELKLTAETHAAAATPPLSTLKLLLVEDNAVNQRVTLSQLKHLGFTADVASDGEVALHMMTQASYDIVLMDCQMPGLDGYSTTREIRRLECQQLEQQPTIIIALTANAMKEDRENCLAVGMDDYLSKPLLKEVLAARLSHWSQILLARCQPAAGGDLAHAATRQAMTQPEASSMSIADEISARQTSNIETSSIETTAVPCQPGQRARSTPLQGIHWEQLHQLSDGNEAFELELLQVFVKDVSDRLMTLEGAIAQTNFYDLEQAAHYIKGASANVGLITIASLADQIERQARQRQLQDAAKQLPQLQQALDDVRRFLSEG